MEALKFGVAGLGGYATDASNALLDFAVTHPQKVKLIAACDPNLQANHDRATVLAAQGVQITDDFQKLLATDIDAVWLPVPIALHLDFTRRALLAGKAVLVEKPAAGSLGEVDAMIAARDRARLPVAVGFQTLFEPAAWETKRKLLSGEIGRLRRAHVIACWPRSEAYYQRNNWAGKIKHNGADVLDSPANNAMAHFVNLAMFLLGPSLHESAKLAEIEAELYRVNDIENYDTCTLRVTTSEGVALLIALTHACRARVEATINIIGDAGSLQFTNRRDYTFIRGDTRDVLPVAAEPLSEVIRNFTAYAAGDSAAQYASLENARAHTAVVCASQRNAPIIQIPKDLFEQCPGAGSSPLRFIPGIENALQASAEGGQLLSDTKLLWAIKV